MWGITIDPARLGWKSFRLGLKVLRFLLDAATIWLLLNIAANTFGVSGIDYLDTLLLWTLWWVLALAPLKTCIMEGTLAAKEQFLMETLAAQAEARTREQQQPPVARP